MKRIIQTLLVVSSLIIVLTACTSNQSDAKSQVTVENINSELELRFPVPNYISQQAQELLSQPVGEGYPAVSGDTWIEMRKQSVENMSSTIEQLIEIHEVDVNEITINGVKVYEVLPKDKSLLKVDKVILLTHGGAYVSMNEKTSILEGIALSGKGNYRVLAVDYRMPPEHPFPAAIEDCVAVYKALLNEYSSEKIAIVGGSAGGGLAMTTTLSIRDEMLPLPAAVIANTPWSDMNKIGDTYFTNEYVDPALITYDGYVESAALLYANGEDLMNPLLSPVYADYSKGFPPTFLSSGTRDLFLSNTVRLHRALRKENIEAELHVFEAMWHSLFMLPVEGTELVNEMLIFLETHLS